MKYIKTEFKLLFPICVFVFLIGFSSSVGLGLALMGLYLLAEHRYSYGRWDIKDILGHENFGIVLLLIGLGLMNNWIGFIVSLIIYLLFSNYKWEDIPPFEYALKKLNLIKFWSKK